MITIEELDDILNRMRRAGIASLVLEEGGEKLVLKLDLQPAPAASRHICLSPAIGQFLRAHPRLSEPAASVGTRVKPGDILGFVAVDGLLRAVSADRDGTVQKFLVETGSLVGFGEPVAAIE